VWADALADLEPEATTMARPFTGRLGRSIETDYVRAANSPDAPRPVPYPVQLDLTAAMRQTGLDRKDIHRMQLWAGQSAAFASRGTCGGTSSAAFGIKPKRFYRDARSQQS
jgi:nitronate monooxygenase